MTMSFRRRLRTGRIVIAEPRPGRRSPKIASFSYAPTAASNGCGGSSIRGGARMALSAALSLMSKTLRTMSSTRKDCARARRGLRAWAITCPTASSTNIRAIAKDSARFLYISAGVEKLTGVTVEEALADANALYAQVLPEYLPKLIEAEHAARRDLTDFAMEAPIRRKDGEVRWMRLRSRPERRANGEILWNGVWTDITASVADQERLRQSEAMLRGMGDSLPDSGLYRWARDPNGVAQISLRQRRHRKADRPFGRAASRRQRRCALASPARISSGARSG